MVHTANPGSSVAGTLGKCSTTPSGAVGFREVDSLPRHSPGLHTMPEHGHENLTYLNSADPFVTSLPNNSYEIYVRELFSPKQVSTLATQLCVLQNACIWRSTRANASDHTYKPQPSRSLAYSEVYTRLSLFWLAAATHNQVLCSVLEGSEDVNHVYSW